MFGVSAAAAGHAIVAQAFGGIGDFQFRGGTPQSLEIVIATRLFAEHVNDEASKIKERPFSGALPFAMLWRALRVFVQLRFDLSANSLHLRGAEAGTNDKVLRERAQAAQIEDRNCPGFFFLCRMNGQLHTFWKGF